MKQLIVLLSTILLGVIIVNLIIGPEPMSIYSTTKNIWESEIEARDMTVRP